MKKFLLSIIALAFIGFTTNNVQAMQWLSLKKEPELKSDVAKDLYRTMPRWYQYGLSGKINTVDLTQKIDHEVTQINSKSKSEIQNGAAVEYFLTTISQDLENLRKANRWEARKSRFFTGVFASLSFLPVVYMVLNDDYRDIPWRDIATIVAGGIAYHQYNNTKAINLWKDNIPKTINPLKEKYLRPIAKPTFTHPDID